jgi:chloramphenicol-sensitive protein RarD
VISLRHLPLTIVGNLQYLNPSLMFLLAVLVFQESLNALKLAGFSLIWAALLYQLFKPTPPEAAVSPAKKLSHPEH